MKWNIESPWSLLLALVGAFVASVLVSRPKTVLNVVARGVSGLVCAQLLTPILMETLSLSAVYWRDALAGLLVVTGYSIVRAATELTWRDVLKLLRAGK
ncbi:hypothetical protein [Polycladidibacter hongkongensis]|uniref:hypothetical protein n=1 Tax=Polycladidibacter hongkongensis TaxID=1647556 RepID=UPI00082B3763|nr:hypothetical protein [Pseudovibrio hongkongensis]